MRATQFQTSSPALCWHCCGETPALPVRVPLPLDHRRSRHYTGSFCSFACAKRWCIDERLTNAIVGLVVSNGGADIAAAPPRQCFKRFGGPLDSPINKAVQLLPPLATPLKLTMVQEDALSGVSGRQDALFREFVKQRRYVQSPQSSPSTASTKAPPRRTKKKKKQKEKAVEKKMAQSMPMTTLASFIVPAPSAEAACKSPCGIASKETSA